MKLLKTALFASIFLFATTTTHAQFFKKLKEKAQQKIEREAERRAQRRIDKKIDDVFDNAEKTIDGKNKTSDKSNFPKDNDAELPANYKFEWKYVLKMESKKTKGKGDIKMIYYLNTDTPAFATKFEIADKGTTQGNMITILDPTTGSSVMLMDIDGNKMRQNMPSFSSDDIDDATQQQVANDYTIVKIDTKTILGYHCQGFKVTSNDGITTMYIAQNAPVSFNNTMSGDSKFKPKGFDPKWFKDFENGLMLEMQFTSNKKEKYNMKMTCIELVKESLTINMSEYKSMF